MGCGHTAERLQNMRKEEGGEKKVVLGANYDIEVIEDHSEPPPTQPCKKLISSNHNIRRFTIRTTQSEQQHCSRHRIELEACRTQSRSAADIIDYDPESVARREPAYHREISIP